MFEGRFGFERNRNFQAALATIMAAIVLGYILYVRVTAPNPSSVDGIYRNNCCDDIKITNGKIIHGQQTFELKVVEMKFGLTGYVDGRFTRSGILKAKEPTLITFLDGVRPRALSIPIDRHDYIFRLVR